MLILHVWFPSDGEGGGGREGEREGGREGGILCCPFLQQYPVKS